MSDLPEHQPSRRSLIVFEIFAMLALFYIPALFSAVESFVARGRSAPNVAFSSDISLWNRTLSFGVLIPILLYIAWRGAGDLQRYGLGLGVRWAGALIVPVYFLDRFIAWVGMMAVAVDADGPPIARILLPWVSTPHFQVPFAHIVAVLVHLSVGVFLEEFVMRGYLIRRLIDLTGKPWVAILVSSAMFGSYHIYQGVAGAVTISFLGLIYAMTLRVTRSIWPAFVAHWAVDAFIELGRMGVLGIR